MIIKGFKNPFTYDEARTYLDYVKPKDIFKFAIANNHPLNTVLMIGATYIGNSPFILRLPNIILGLMYLATSYRISKKFKNSLITFLILSLSPLLFEFFTLARGYGLASCLIFFGTVNYFYVEWNKFSILLSSILFFLAIYSIFVSSIYVFCFFAVVIFNEVKKKNYFNFILSSMVVGFASYQTMRWMITITEYDAYLYGLESKNIDKVDLISSVFGFGPLFNPYMIIFGNILLYGFIFLSIFVLFRNLIILKNYQLEIIFILTTALLYIIPSIFDTKLPQFRVLLPFLPPLLLIIIKNINKFLEHETKYSNVVLLLFSSFIIFNFITTFHLQNTFDWRLNKVEPEDAIIFYINPENGKCYYPYIENPVAQYYKEQSLENNKIYCEESTGIVYNQNQN